MAPRLQWVPLVIEWLQALWRAIYGIGEDASPKTGGEPITGEGGESGGVVDTLTKPAITSATADLSDGFFDALARVGKDQKWDPRLLLAVMSHESGIRANAHTPGSDAYGLIQWDAPKGKYAFIITLSAEQQVPYIRSYYVANAPYATIGEVYGQNYLPDRMKRRGRAPGTVLASKGEGDNFYEDNPSLDYNHDGQITIQDLEDTANAAAKKLGTRYTEAYDRLTYAMSKLGASGPTGPINPPSFPWLGMIAVIVGLGWIIGRGEKI